MIREDAGTILVSIYRYKTEAKEITRPNQLSTETGWNEDRLNNAIEYLIESRFIDGDIQRPVGTTKVRVAFGDITKIGIDIVEKQKEFKQNFGFAVNLGIFQINWGMQES